MKQCIDSSHIHFDKIALAQIITFYPGRPIHTLVYFRPDLPRLKNPPRPPQKNSWPKSSLPDRSSVSNNRPIRMLSSDRNTMMTKAEFRMKVTCSLRIQALIAYKAAKT